jgi:FAD/FMN-containing dehydrogenase/Fe-S oxidoreductase
MIPRLDPAAHTQDLYLRFLIELEACGFAGEIQRDYANRVALATDNSIYQVLSQGTVYPRSSDDLMRLTGLANQPNFHEIVLTPRGGGTGTNGQSLTDGLVVDLSKHMNRILEFNREERWVRVEAGVVKDQLNKFLKPYGLFFAPELSTSDRATIGGMINTDASGQGSCTYGKTRDHVLALKTVWLDGSCWHSEPLGPEHLDHVKQRQDRIGQVHRDIDRLIQQHRHLIETRFPKLTRCLTGYDLAHVRDTRGRFDLNSILCGSEGTLAFVTEAKLNLVPIPGHVALVNIGYRSFQDALRDAQVLMQVGPSSIETVDSKVLDLARNDVVWTQVSEFFPERGIGVRGINLVELAADSEPALLRQVERLCGQLQTAHDDRRTGYTVAIGHARVKRIWGMRKKAVGLLGNTSGERKPIPFVEDTAVPPAHLADFIQEFRALLDSHGLDYGMFGHVDAGVLHVRPALDMKDPMQVAVVRAITDAVVRLVNKYNGLLWGEHGKGVRSEYVPEVFGPDLYRCLQTIKAAFDPRNQLNPGKICTPIGSDATLLKIDGVTTRGEHDRRIPAAVRTQFASALNCNGNGSCFNFDPDTEMCPSWKGTRERIHSPKGRASLMREWLRLLAQQSHDPIGAARAIRRGNGMRSLFSKWASGWRGRRGQYDFSHEVYEAMAGCLGCKSCVTQCPVRVNIPELRSQFLELYHSRYPRPIRDHIVGVLEFLIPWLAKRPAFYNALMRSPPFQRLLARFAGMVDAPSLCVPNPSQAVLARRWEWATPRVLTELPADERVRSIILVQDAFTSFFETELVIDIIALLRHIGFRVLVAPFSPNGKPLHVHGFLRGFERTARAHTQRLAALAKFGIPLVGVDPSMTLTFRDEYVKALPGIPAPEVRLLQEWLVGHLERLRPFAVSRADFLLLAHCTEKTALDSATTDWQRIFSALGLQLDTLPTGCCGMAGTYGHESRNRATSERIFALSWDPIVRNPNNRDKLVATGYSCRSQVKRLHGRRIPHPAQVLLQLLQTGKPNSI